MRNFLALFMLITLAFTSCEKNEFESLQKNEPSKEKLESLRLTLLRFQPNQSKGGQECNVQSLQTSCQLLNVRYDTHTRGFVPFRGSVVYVNTWDDGTVDVWDNNANGGFDHYSFDQDYMFEYFNSWCKDFGTLGCQDTTGPQW